MEDPNPAVAGSGLTQLVKAGIRVESGLLEKEARELNPGFIKRMDKGLPWVRVKLAMSLDGRTAMASGESQWITHEASRQDVQRLRARSSAILTGIGTVIADDPSMNVRLSAEELGLDAEPSQPLRVIIDSQLKCPQDAKMLGLPGKTVIFTATDDIEQCTNEQLEIISLPGDDGRVDLRAVMQWLAQHEMNEVHVEAGSVLCGSLLEAELVDEIVIYMAPHLMGDQAKGLFHLPELERMNQRIGLEISDIRPIAKDWRITAYPKRRLIEEL
jgi:diaminohydroxyphosphoribosylaminopyrimidine deaminase/5-amino-6-(5-phosphoribosylamino)uracil reductase